MALQLEAPETIRLIEEVSRRTGETSERAVQVAMQERLPEPVPQRTPEEEAARRAKIHALVRELNAIFKEHPEAMIDHGELLYGEDGLPK